MADLNRAMSKDHEADICERLGARPSRGSGNQFNTPMDGRQHRLLRRFAFAFDGKATRGESIGVGRRMWAKAVDQAGGERPMLALRFYRNDRLSEYDPDLAVISMDDLLELIEAAEANDSRPGPPCGAVWGGFVQGLRCCLSEGHYGNHEGRDPQPPHALITWAPAATAGPFDPGQREDPGVSDCLPDRSTP